MFRSETSRVNNVLEDDVNEIKSIVGENNIAITTDSKVRLLTETQNKGNTILRGVPHRSQSVLFRCTRKCQLKKLTRGKLLRVFFSENAKCRTNGMEM